MPSDPVNDLRALIARTPPRVVVVVGSGVSIGATGNAPAASWDGLLKLGVEACRACDPELKEDVLWAERVLADIQSKRLRDTLSAAERVHSLLEDSGQGEFKRWLREAFEGLTPHHRAVLDALAALGVPLVTTNYDGLLEAVTGLPTVTWQDQADEFRILHLHGHWKKPESIVLGIRSYDRVKGDPHARAVIESLAMSHTLLFVGCGAGLEDPNFERFLTWLGSVNARNEARHYRLALDGEVIVLQKRHAADQRVRVLGYGPSHDHLAGFLARLTPSKQSSTPGAGRSGAARSGALSPALVEYRRRLDAATSKIELIGLGRGVAVDLPIEQAYIHLRTAVARDIRRLEAGRFDDPRAREVELREEDIDLASLFQVAARFGERAAVLLGDPGAGKTTGARQFCWRLLHPETASETAGLPARTFPVFLRLRHLTPDLPGRDLKSFVFTETASAALSDDLGRPGPDLLARPGVLWVFDGLDEVVSEAARVRVCGWIREWQAHRPDDFVLVTSRFEGYQGDVDLGSAFCQFHVQPLNAAQSAEFVSRWYRAVFRRLHGAEAAIEAKAKTEADALLALLQETAFRIGRLRELPANPLLLTILCLVHHEDHSLPRKRADVYARCVRVLLEHWRQEMRKAQGLAAYDPGAAERVLAALAWWLHHEENRTSATLGELRSQAAVILTEVSEASGLGRDGDAFVRRMRDESGILAMWGAGRCGFLHLTFQEYLAGIHAAREGLAVELVARMGSSWWREALLVALATGSRSFARDFFAALLATEVTTWDVSLVDQCLDEASVVLLEPFLDALRDEGAGTDRKATILRRLRTIEQPDLVEVCRGLAKSRDGALAALAAEVVQRAEGQAAPAMIRMARCDLEAFVDPKTGIAFVAIPAGEFDMGSARGEDREKPVHRVRVSAFAIGRYPVTNAEYARFLEANPGQSAPDYWKASRLNEPKQPVVGVSWDDAQAFCQWAGARLLTEAEWEYACRAGSPTEYCFGDEEVGLREHAWYSANSESGTHAVGEKKPNAWGVHDMHGNVFEWCEDWFGGYEIGPVTDPNGPKEGVLRVLRGGSWFITAANCRSAFRYGNLPALRSNSFGFRVVLVPQVSSSRAEPEGRGAERGRADEGGAEGRGGDPAARPRGAGGVGGAGA